MEEIHQLSTEKRNPNTLNLDRMSIIEALRTINEEDKKVAHTIEKALPEISQAVQIVTQRFKEGGRLIYMGAGTSGRLGILDASECPPTFGVSQDKVIGLIAGGQKAISQPIEGAEDSFSDGANDLKQIKLSKKDVLVGLAASGRTPYVVGGIEYANKIGVATIAIACNKASKIGRLADVAIEADSGPEVLTGSTRLKAGTAQKMILNMISTVTMVQVGKVYQNLMVDVLQSNDKLKTRAQNIVIAATGVEEDLAQQALQASQGSVKVAILMILLDIDPVQACEKLDEVHGKISEAIKEK